MALPGLSLWSHLASPPVFSTTLFGYCQQRSSRGAGGGDGGGDGGRSGSSSPAPSPPPYSSTATTPAPSPPSASAAAATLRHLIRYGIPAANFAVFVAWRRALEQARSAASKHAAAAAPAAGGLLARIFGLRAVGLPPPPPPLLLTFLERNFVLSLENLIDGRWWNFLTASFSHRSLWHFLHNFVALEAVTQVGLGPDSAVSPLDFFVVLVGSAVTANAACVWNPLDGLHNTLGASGVVCGLTAFVAFSAPRPRDVHLFGLPCVVLPGPAAVVATGLIDFMLLGSTSTTRIAHAGHLGGAAFGLTYYWVKSGRLIPRCWAKQADQLEVATAAAADDTPLGRLRNRIGQLGVSGRIFLAALAAVCFRLSIRLSLDRDCPLT